MYLILQYPSVCGPWNSRFLALKFRLLKCTLSVLSPTRLPQQWSSYRILGSGRAHLQPGEHFLRRKVQVFLQCRVTSRKGLGLGQVEIIARDRCWMLQGSPMDVHVCWWDVGVRWPPLNGVYSSLLIVEHRNYRIWIIKQLIWGQEHHDTVSTQ